MSKRSSFLWEKNARQRIKKLPLDFNLSHLCCAYLKENDHDDEKEYGENSRDIKLNPSWIWTQRKKIKKAITIPDFFLCSLLSTHRIDTQQKDSHGIKY